jgi:hypothetical protein
MQVKVLSSGAKISLVVRILPDRSGGGFKSQLRVKSNHEIFISQSIKTDMRLTGYGTAPRISQIIGIQTGPRWLQQRHT